MAFWLYLVMFIVAILVPDIVRQGTPFLLEDQLEELFLFFLGIIGFGLYLWKESQFLRQEEETERDRKRLDQTIKDLVESYNYIGEVNRKMDILMGITLGLSEKSALNRKKEFEIYHAIIEAAVSLTKASCSSLVFVDINRQTIVREIGTDHCAANIEVEKLLQHGLPTAGTDQTTSFIASSHQEIRGIKSFLLAKKCERWEDKTEDLLRVLASQALFLYSFSGQTRNQHKQKK